LLSLINLKTVFHIPKQYTRSPMSILKDLDPQYAKLHTERLPKKAAIWSGLALLAVGGSYWIATQSMTKALPTEATPSSVQKPLEPSNGVPMNRDSPRESSLENAKLPASLNNPSVAAAAMIQDAPLPKKSTDQQIVPPVSATIESPDRKTLANTEYSRPAQRSPVQASPTTAEKSENTKRKSNSMQAVAQKEKTHGSGGKKQGERDIDIITAIVR
jgi:hypothetical protein